MLRQKTDSIPMELSYYRLLLLSFLKDFHPDKELDAKFIVTRGDSAAEAYSEAVKSGLDHMQASEIANNILYEGLHFSPYTVIIDILENEFADKIPLYFTHEIARILLPACVYVSEKYQIKNDDFANSDEYPLFYNELVGYISSLIDGL